MYTADNQSMEEARVRLNREAAPDDAFHIAVGDDSHLKREIEALASATPYSEYVEDDEEEDKRMYVQSEEGRAAKVAGSSRRATRKASSISSMSPSAASRLRQIPSSA